jgi:hypothetical protein
MPDFETPRPGAGWTRPDYDDGDWERGGRGKIEFGPRGNGMAGGNQLHAATLSASIYTRVRFDLVSPDQAGELRMSMSYVGGVVVYLNGQEIGRGHMPHGPVEPDSLAERYPDDLYCDADGKYIQHPGKSREAFSRRYRKIDLVLPAKLLRAGTNCLAVQVVRAPMNWKALRAKRKNRHVGLWPYVGYRPPVIESSTGRGLARPSEATEVWNPGPRETLRTYSRGEPLKLLRPVVVHAARNGVFSGRLAIGSAKAISNLSVKVGGLKPGKTANGTAARALPIPAVRVRHAVPATRSTSWRRSGSFDAIVSGVPKTVPVRTRGVPRGAAKRAVLPLWFTVRTPRDCTAGVYEAPVTISAAGLAPVKATLRVVVHGWTLPDPKDFRQRHLIRLEQEASAYHYKVPLWSKKHFEHMGKSLSLMAEINSRLVPLNFARDFYGEDRESMVRWVKQADGSYKHDFTILDKYLDLIDKELVAKHGGKPFPLSLNCWGETDRKGKEEAVCGANVSLLEGRNGTSRCVPLKQPRIGTEESYRFWKPVFDEVLKRIKARGWLEVTAFGHNSYCHPPKRKVVNVAWRLWPKGVWNYTAHNGTLATWQGSDPGIKMRVGYASQVWGERRMRPRGGRTLVQRRNGAWVGSARTRHFDGHPLVLFRNLPQEMVLRGYDGVGDFGADNFPFKRGTRKGRYYYLSTGRGTGGGDNASTRSLLAPGPEGPVPTERFEMLREGTELGEAIVFLERALARKKLPEKLARRIGEFLETRGNTFIYGWYKPAAHELGMRPQWPLPGPEDDAKLLQLAGEAAGAMGK